MEQGGRQQVAAVVADRGLPLHGEPNVFELLAHIAQVRVDDFSRPRQAHGDLSLKL